MAGFLDGLRQNWFFAAYIDNYLFSYTDMDQKIMPRGLRNNNPGNLEKSRSNPWQGEIVPSGDRRFAQFVSMELGYRALLKLLRNYIVLHQCDTIGKIINRWAPPVENNTDGYIRRVEAITGLTADAVISPDDKTALMLIASAISEVENGVKADFNQILEGWKLLN
jgi:hypothetical protein